MNNLKTLNQKTGRTLVHVYDVETNNTVDFSIKFFENEDGFREFEIVIATDSKMNYNDIMNHHLYNNFVLPWTYKEKELASLLGDNVVQFNKYRS